MPRSYDVKDRSVVYARLSGDSRPQDMVTVTDSLGLARLDHASVGSKGLNPVGSKEVRGPAVEDTLRKLELPMHEGGFRQLVVGRVASSGDQR
jgi:hypothetical protein